MAVNDTWKVSVYCTFGTQTAVNVRYYQIINQVGNIPTAAAVAGFFDSTLNAAYKACMGATATWHGVHAMHWRPGEPRVGAMSTANLGFGSVAGDLLPTQVCGLISLRTNVATRRGRGRVYVPFPAEASSAANGNPIAAYQTSLAALANILDNDLPQVGGGVDTTWRPVIFGPELRDEDGNIIQAERITEVVAAAPSGLWATQRRRAGRGRPNAPPT